MARDAGYTEYVGLPGAIKTGCMNTPQKKSRHCSLHTVTACVQRSHISASDDEAPDNLEMITGNQIVEVLLDKKVTRKCTYYKV